ncbi:LOW QUALITY PROTEIN: uncharacterized protein ACR2FA_000685 [Aphomia sociella]
MFTKQVHDVMLSKIDNAYNAFGPLNAMLKIFSLNCNFQCETSTDLFCLILKYAITVALLGAFNFFTLYYKISKVYSAINPSIKITDAVQMVFDYFQYLVDLCYVYKYGRQVSVEYFKQYAYIDDILGVTYYPVIKKRVTKCLVFFLFSWLVISACDYAAWALGFGWIIPIMYAIAYIFLLIKILTTLDFSGHAMQIECRLKTVCDLLHQCYSLLEPLPGVSTDCIRNENWFYSDTCKRITKVLSKTNTNKRPLCNNSYEVKRLCRCYLIIIEQSMFINKMFGIRFLLNSLSLLIDMIRFTNITVRVIIGSQQTIYDSAFFPAVTSLLRLLMCVVILINLVDNCEKVYGQSDKILCIIDHLLINRQLDNETRAALTELRDLIQSRPIYFNVANFFRLNYSMLLSIASVVVTYTIILLQSMN